MLAFATKYNQVSLVNLTGHLLQGTQPRVKEIVELVKILRVEIIPWDTCLRLAAVLSEHEHVALANRLMAAIDIEKYVKNANNVGKINLLVSTLIAIGRGDDALRLLESVSFCERYSTLDDMVIRLRAAYNFLLYNQVASAEKVAIGVDPIRFVEQAQYSTQLMFFLNTMVCFPEPVELFQQLESRTTDLIAEETLFDKKFEVTNRLIMQGRSKVAKQVLAGIATDGLVRKEQFESLILSLVHLSLFDEAELAFKEAVDKGLDSPDIYTCMAAMALCCGEPQLAYEYIDGYAPVTHRTASNTLWKAKLHNYTGNHDRALNWVDVLLADYGSVPVYRCFGLVEKGNTLRAKGSSEEALRCYQDAQAINVGPVFWLWIAYFEHAMTLFHNGEHEAALKTAWKGCKCKSYPYKEMYNPCYFLYQFLLYWLNRSIECFVPPEKWFDAASHWPFTYMPHKLWMYLLLTVSLEKREHERINKQIVSEIVNSLGRAYNCQKKHINSILISNDLSCDRQFIDALHSALWPNEYNWQIIRALV